MAGKKLIAVDKHLSNIECIHNYNIDIENRVIYLSSEYDDDKYNESGTEHQMYSRFVKNMDLLNSTGQEPIKIRSSNIGGDWNYGMAIFDIIRRSKSPTHFFIDAYACSMGSIVPQSATRRFISKHADFLIHNGTYDMHGQYEHVEKHWEFYKTNTPRMFEIFADRCVNAPAFKGKKKADVIKFLESKVDKDREWWLHADEAVHYGFADEIY
jgi:ATP-dependent protease ClpP protease subunit